MYLLQFSTVKFYRTYWFTEFCDMTRARDLVKGGASRVLWISLLDLGVPGGR